MYARYFIFILLNIGDNLTSHVSTSCPHVNVVFVFVSRKMYLWTQFEIGSRNSNRFCNLWTCHTLVCCSLLLISVLMSVLQLHNDVHCFFELGRFFETFSCSVVSVISQKKSVMLNFQRLSNICLDLICLLCFVGRFRDVHSVGRSVDISRRLSSGLPGHDSTAQPLLHRQLTQHVTIYPNDVVLRLAWRV